MIYIDLTHTAHTQSRTGIQRVCRNLYKTISIQYLDPTDKPSALTYDPYAQHWRPLRQNEIRCLETNSSSNHRKATWSRADKWKGRFINLFGVQYPPLPFADGLIVPELYGPDVIKVLPQLFSKVKGAKIALFHDAISLKLPALTSSKTVGRFPNYLHSLTRFDGIAAVSQDSREVLLDYWRWAGWKGTPPVVALPLGIDRPPELEMSVASLQNSAPTVLSVGTLEGRKNHLSLLAACERLWAEGLVFNLHLVGMVQRQTGRSTLEEVVRLQAAGHPLRYDGPVDDIALENAYASCTFTVYPSLMEGFGLPVLESVHRGKPCVCLDRGALAESARGGGCLTVPEATPEHLAAAMRKLLTSPEDLRRLSHEARLRPLRTWGDYTRELLDWMKTLPVRAS